MLLRRSATGPSISKQIVYPNRPPLQAGPPRRWSKLGSLAIQPRISDVASVEWNERSASLTGVVVNTLWERYWLSSQIWANSVSLSNQ